MRKISTQPGVYAILLIAALYGSISRLDLRGKTVQEVSVITGKLVSSTENGHTFLRLPSSESYNLTPFNSVTLQANITAKPGAELNFFAYSATIQHYINTL